MNKSTFIYIVFFFLHTIVCAQSAVITNVAPNPNNNTITVTYNITGGQGETYSVELWYSLDGAAFKKCNSTSTTEGDLSNIKTGQGKQIVWDVLKDVPKIIATSVDFEIRIKLRNNSYYTPKSRNQTIQNSSNNTKSIPGYEGESIDGKKNGHGKMIYKNGNVYVGEWKDDKKDGQGKMVYKDGSSYEGGWKDDIYDGEAVILNTGSKYVGAYVKGLREGKGIVYDNNGVIKCEYNYVKGKLEGYNKISSDKDNDYESTTIEGFFENSELNGQGNFISKDKDGTVTTFNGEFKNTNMYNGIIITVKPNGTIFNTRVKNGVIGKTKKQKK